MAEAPQTPNRDRGSSAQPTTPLQTPSKDKTNVYNARSNTPAARQSYGPIMASIVKEYRSSYGDPIQQESFVFKLVQLLERLVVDGGLDPRIMVTPAMAARASSVLPEDDDDDAAIDEDADDLHDQDHDTDRDSLSTLRIGGGSVHTFTPLPTLDESRESTVVGDVVDLDRLPMYDTRVLASLELKQGSGKSQEDPRISGSLGVSLFERVTVPLCQDIDIATMNERKIDFNIFFMNKTTYVKVNQNWEYVMPHPYTVALVSDLLFGMFDKPGISNLRALISAIKANPEPSLHITPTRAAEKAQTAAFKGVFQACAAVLGPDIMSPALHGLLRAQTDLNFSLAYDGLKNKINQDHSIEMQEVANWERKNHIELRRGTKNIDRCKMYIAAQMSTNKEKLSDILRRVSPIKALVTQLGPGVLTLMRKSDQNKFSKVIVQLMPAYAEKFVELNPEVAPILEMLRIKVYRPIVKGSFAVFDQYEVLSAPVRKTDDVAGYIRRQLTARVEEVDDEIMADA